MARMFIAGTLIVSTTLGFLTLTQGHDWGDDFAQYLLQAQSIAEGRPQEFIEDNRFTIENSTETIGSYVYPWGCPLCLAPVCYFLQFDLIALKCVNLLFFELTLLCLYALFARRLGERLSCLLVAMLAFNPNLLEFLDCILSDVPFMFFAVFSMYLINKVVVHREYLVNCWASQALLGAGICAAMLTRPNGVFLLPILFVTQVWEYGNSSGRSRTPIGRQLLFGIAPYAVCLSLKWSAGSFLPDDSSNQVAYFHFSWLSIAKNSVYYLGIVSKLFGVTYQNEILFGLSLPFLIMGIKARWRMDYHFLMFCGLNQLLYTVWPGRGGMRYVMPMMPFYLYFMFQGVSFALLSLRRVSVDPTAAQRRLPKIVFVCGVLVAASLLVESACFACWNLQSQRQMAGPYDADSTEMFTFVSRHTPSNARLIFFKPRAVRLVTQRHAFSSNRPADLAKADYLVIHKKFDLCNQIRFPDSASVDPVFENSTFVIYRILDNL